MYSQLISAINNILYSNHRMDNVGVDKFTKQAIKLAEELPAASEILSALKNGEIISFIRNNNDYFVPLVNKIAVKAQKPAKTPKPQKTHKPQKTQKPAKEKRAKSQKLKCFTNSFRYLASCVL